MRNKKSICVILLIFILTMMLFTLTGCYDASSVERFYYTFALGIDLSENNLYNISIQIAKNDSSSDSSSGGSSQSSEYTIYTVEAETVDSGINIMNNYLNKQVNLSHCSVIVFSEELARKGLGNVMNSLANNNEIRPDAYVLVSSKKAVDVLEKVSNSGENFSSRFYEYIINSVETTGYSMVISFDHFLSKINNSKGDASAIYTYVNDDTIQNNGLAIFKDDYMVGKVTPLHSIVNSILENKLDSALITIPNPLDSSSNIDLELSTQKLTHKEVKIINNTPYIKCEMFLNANIRTSGKTFDYTDSKNIEKVEESASEYLEKISLDYLYLLSKEYNSDVLDFENILSKSCKTNEELENYHFDKIYKDSFFDVKANINIDSTHLFDKE